MPPKAAKEIDEAAPLTGGMFERTEQEEQCERIFKDVAKTFKRLQKTSNADKIHVIIKEITGKLRDAKTLIKDFEREARADGMPAGELTSRKKELATQLNGFIEMKKAFAQSEVGKADLLNGAQGEIEMGLEGMSMQQLMTKGRKDISEIDKTLVRAERIVEDTKAVGVQVASELNDQTKKLEKIMDDLNEIEFTMKKASQVIRDITRGLLTDKCIAFLLLLVVVGVVAIIVVKIIDPKKAKQGAAAVISNVTDAINSTSTGQQITGAVTGAFNTAANAAGRRMMVSIEHLLDRRRP